MGKLWLLLASAAIGVSAYAAQPVTVEQLRQYLAHQQAAHTTDDAVAHRLRTAEMSERLTDATLDRFVAEFHPGSGTAAALELLADRSAFLPPPAGELPRRDPPSAAEQQIILHAASNFITATLAHMPDFLATRTTKSFEDIPVITPARVFQSGLHSTGVSVRETAYRNGREVPGDTSSAADVHRSSRAFPVGLLSIGEFGQDLAIILSDSAKSSIEWSRWEQTPAGVVAVFSFAVPKQASHYKIYFCCEWNPAANAPTSYEGMPAYHGSLAVDPASGAILRVTLQVDFEDFDPQPDYSIAVQFGAVDIGGRKAILPIHSVTLGQGETLARERYWSNLFIDDIRFTNYRRFGSTARIVTNSASR